MLEILDLLLIFLIMLLAGAVFILLGYYYYKNHLKLSEEGVEDPFAAGLEGLISGFGDVITTSLKEFKVDIDMTKISDQITQSFYGTFLAILGVDLEDEKAVETFNFDSYIKNIIDSSVEAVVPETIKQFEALLPAFADSFIEGIQQALTGVVADMPEGSPQQQVAQQVQGAMPEMDIGKVIQSLILQQIVKSLSGSGGLGNLIGGLGGAGAPVSGGQSGF